MMTRNLAAAIIVTELLSSSNYENWQVLLRNYLLSQDLWEIVDGSEPKPKPSKTAELKTWKTKNAKALHAIQISCAPELFSHIRDMDSAKAAWDQLASTHSEASEEKELLLNKGPTLTDEGNLTWCLPLYIALSKGDWETAKRFLDVHPNAISGGITETGETALHIAVLSGKVQLAQELVKLMSAETLELKNNKGATSLSLAAVVGMTETAKVMVRKNSNLVRIQNEEDLIPVVVSAMNGNKEMVRYLYSVTPIEELSPNASKNGVTLVTSTIKVDLYDVALDLLGHYPQLVVSWDRDDCTAMEILAGRPSAFPSGNRYGFFQQWIYSCIPAQLVQREAENLQMGSRMKIAKINQVCHLLQGLVWKALKLLVPGVEQIHNTKLIHVQASELVKVICSQISTFNESQLTEAQVFDVATLAAECGIIEFLIELINSNLDLMLTHDEHYRGLFQLAVMHRQEKIFNFINHSAPSKERAALLDKFNNTILHFAGTLAPQSQLLRVSGAALQMQRELQWFQEVEKVGQPEFKELMNDDGKIPAALFTEEHRELVKEGEQWMKETAQACMIVSTLIATIMFTMAFTVPGGNNGDIGIPIFLKSRAFSVFMASDAVSLFSSCTAVLMFLAILTSRYAEMDFLSSLPKKLIIGLASLFISVAAMMAAFGAALVIVLHQRVSWVAIPVTLLACIPVALFGLLQFPLFLETVFSTYGSGIFTK